MTNHLFCSSDSELHEEGVKIIAGIYVNVFLRGLNKCMVYILISLRWKALFKDTGNYADLKD